MYLRNSNKPSDVGPRRPKKIFVNVTAQYSVSNGKKGSEQANEDMARAGRDIELEDMACAGRGIEREDMACAGRGIEREGMACAGRGIEREGMARAGIDKRRIVWDFRVCVLAEQKALACY